MKTGLGRMRQACGRKPGTNKDWYLDTQVLRESQRQCVDSPEGHFLSTCPDTLPEGVGL